MYFKEYKKELKTTISRTKKKNKFKKLFILIINSNSYLNTLKYNLLKYFFKNQKLGIQNQIFNELIKEEQGFRFSINN